MKVDKSQYMNTSKLPQIDKLASALFDLFDKFTNYIRSNDMYEDTSDVDLEARDKVGFTLSPSDQLYSINKAKEAFNPENFENVKRKVNTLHPSHGMNTKEGTSMQMTSVLSNSKVSGQNYAQI